MPSKLTDVVVEYVSQPGQTFRVYLLSLLLCAHQPTDAFIFAVKNRPEALLLLA